LFDCRNLRDLTMMTTDAAISTDGPGETQSPPRRAVGIWLLTCCFMIFAMCVIGAITRLTESGLSMVEWRPLMGALPPLNEAEWQRVFELYQQSPQYQKVNTWMGLAEFKDIFFWEWFHRLWGRTIGVVFAVPLAYFALRKQIAGDLWPKLISLFLLGAVQGGIGWFMVKSGLVDAPAVSHYRLALHLGFALIIYAMTLWTALGVLSPRAQSPARGLDGAYLARCGWAALFLLGVTITWGAFTAGLDAGFVYNEFPLMGGRLIPSEIADLSPLWLNLLENPVTVQFIHRALGIATALALLAFWACSRRHYLTPRQRKIMSATAGMALFQVGLGIATLLSVVAVPLATLHQAGAVTLLSLLVWMQFELHNSARKAA